MQRIIDIVTERMVRGGTMIYVMQAAATANTTQPGGSRTGGGVGRKKLRKGEILPWLLQGIKCVLDNPGVKIQ